MLTNDPAILQVLNVDCRYCDNSFKSRIIEHDIVVAGFDIGQYPPFHLSIQILFAGISTLITFSKTNVRSDLCAERSARS